MLVDDRPGSLVLIGRIHPDIEIARKRVRMKTTGDRAPLCIGGYGQGRNTIQECSSRAPRWKREDHHGAGHTVVVFILHLNHRLARGTQADVIHRVIAVENGDFQVPARRGLGESRERGQSDCRHYDAQRCVSAHVDKNGHAASKIV